MSTVKVYRIQNHLGLDPCSYDDESTRYELVSDLLSLHKERPNHLGPEKDNLDPNEFWFPGDDKAEEWFFDNVFGFKDYAGMRRWFSGLGGLLAQYNYKATIWEVDTQGVQYSSQQVAFTLDDGVLVSEEEISFK